MSLVTALRTSSLALLATLTAACGSRRTVVITQQPPELVELEVEVYDPDSNAVWEGVGVRILEVAHEWSGAINPDPDSWLFTDEYGRVLFDSVDLAALDLGFQEDEFGRAVVYPERGADEAYILVEVGALGFDTVWVDVPISWRLPAVLVEVPFE